MTKKQFSEQAINTFIYEIIEMKAPIYFACWESSFSYLACDNNMKPVKRALSRAMKTFLFKEKPKLYDFLKTYLCLDITRDL